MIGKEVLGVIAANPGLPVYAMVSSDVCSNEDYCWWFAPRCKACVDEVVREDEIDCDRMWIRSYDEEDMIERYWDACNADASDAEIMIIARNYVENLPWEQCVLLWLEV